MKKDNICVRTSTSCLEVSLFGPDNQADVYKVSNGRTSLNGFTIVGYARRIEGQDW